MITRHPDAALVPYLRGELSDEEGARVARHLEGCAACRAEADAAGAAMRELWRRVEGIPAPDPVQYRAGLYRRLEARRSAAQRRGQKTDEWSRTRIVGFSLGALAAAGVAALILTMRSSVHVAMPPLDQLASPDRIAQEAVMSGADIDMLRDYPIVEHLDLLENYDTIAHLDDLAPSAPASDENRS